MKNAVSELAVSSSIERPPGFLLEPFKWAIPDVIAMLRDRPGHLSDLLHLSRTRMHLIGIALAHLESIKIQHFAEILFRGSAEMILDAAIGRRPPGLKRAITVMPNVLMERQSYRTLVELLVEPPAARLLYHTFEIRDSTIRMMNDVPGPLRAALFSLHDTIGDMSSFSEGLRCISLRSGRISFDELVSELARAREPSQFLAKLKAIVEGLPLPDVLPPARVQHATRIDSSHQLRKLGKQWGNCLGNYVWNVEHGQCAIYLWRDARVQAACSVTRCGRLGWFLDEVRGPENADIESPDVDNIQNAFREAGIPPEAAIGSIAQIVASDGLSPPRRRRRRVRGFPPPADITLPDLDCARLANPTAAP
ncbi:hypothetical protein [Bradyrhizobium diazoefficiens]